jgi:hypothetical protein
MGNIKTGVRFQSGRGAVMTQFNIAVAKATDVSSRRLQQLEICARIVVTIFTVLYEGNLKIREFFLMFCQNNVRALL